MLSLKTYIPFFLFLASAIDAYSQTNSALFPENHLELKNPISYETLVQFTEQAKQTKFLNVTVEGETVEGRLIFLYHIRRGLEPGKWKVLFYAQQHGDEPAGKDALIYLANQIIKNPEILPEDTELWLLPMMNPDGAEKNQRRNGNDFDLNRDHQLLSQPETQTLHRVFRKVMPHIAVDCHEFSRDSDDYDDRGFIKWPLIMMDCGNNPLFTSEIIEAGIRWCEDAKPYFIQKGYNYMRYNLGGFPPYDELRYSAPDVDDGRNGLGVYGGLSFIIESGVLYKSQNPNADLGKRIDAYLILLKQFLNKNKFRNSDLKVIEESRTAKLPEFIPVNYFWANSGQKITNVRIVAKNTGKTVKIPTADFMHELVIKKSVPSPLGYIISREYTERFKDLLDRHELAYQLISENTKYEVEQCTLVRYEDFIDEVYSRYAGRQIVKGDTIIQKEFEAGSIIISLGKTDGKRAALLLEPLQLYGLYQYPEFRSLIGQDKIVPVWRLLNTIN